MRSLILVLLLTLTSASSQSEAADPPLVSLPELPLHQAAVSEAYLGQLAPAAAFNNDQFFVAWTDFRSGSVMPDVFGTRVSSDGEVLDPINVPVAASTDAEGPPAVTWTGEQWVVAYSFYSRQLGSNEVRATHLDTKARVAAIHSPVTGGERDYIPPLLASYGGRTLLVFSQGSVESGLKFFTWGSLTATRSLTSHLVQVALPWRSEFLVLGQVPGNAFRIHATPFSGEGKRGSSIAVFEGFSDGVLHAAASSGDEVLAVVGMPWAPDLILIDSNREVRTVGTVERAMYSPMAAWNGEAFVVAWVEPMGNGSRILAVRLTRTGTLLDPEPVVLQVMDGVASNLTAAGGSGSLLLVWDNVQSIPYRGRSVQAALIRPHHFSGGARAPLIELSRGWKPQLAGAAAPTRSGYFAVWQELEDRSSDGFDRTLSGRLLAAHLGRRGELQADPVVLAENARFDGPPVVIAGEGGNVAAWSDGPAIRIARVDPSGGQPVSTTLPFSGRPSIAFDGSRFMAVFSRDGEVQGVRLDRDLRQIDSVPIPLGGGSHPPAILRSGNEYLLLAAVKQLGCFNLCIPGDPPAIHLRRLTHEGTLIRETLLAEEYGEPTLACGAERCIIAWPRYGGVAWRVASRDLEYLSEVRAFARPDVLNEPPAVAWDGRRFLLFWSEARGERTTLMMALIGDDGLAESEPSVVAEGVAHSFDSRTPWSPRPAAASHGDGTAIAIHGRIETVPGETTRRLFVRTFLESVRRRSVGR